jgi:predicted HTH domain antitoxin
MNKLELVNHVADETGMGKKESARLLNRSGRNVQTFNILSAQPKKPKSQHDTCWRGIPLCAILTVAKVFTVGQQSLQLGGFMMKTLSIKVPDNLEMDEQEAMLIITSKLFEQGKLTLGEAAEATGLSKRAYIEVLGIYGVSVFNLEAEDLASDYRNA